MPTPPSQTLEEKRLATLARTSLLDRPPQEAFDRLTKLAKRLLDVPIALVSLVDSDRQFFTGMCGLPSSVAEAQQTPLSHSFCKHVVDNEKPLIVSDARLDPVLSTNGAVVDLGVIAYLGIPLRVPSAPDLPPLGSLCCIDSEPHDWTKEEIEIVTELAAIAGAEIELLLQMATREEEGKASVVRDQYHKLILDSTAEGIFGLDAQGRFTFANRACLRLLNYTDASDLVGKTAYTTLDPTYESGGTVAEKDFAPTLCVSDGTRSHASGRRLKRKDGSVFASEYWAHPVRVKEQDTVAVVTVIDITARLEEAEHTKRLALIQEFSQDFVGVSDTSNRVISLNKAARKMVGISEDYDVSTLLIDDFHRPETFEMIRTKAIPIAVDKGTWLGESLFVNSNGDTTPVSQLIICHKDNNGQPTHFSTVARDISKQKAEEAALKKGRRNANRENLEKTRFLANMSHEIRTPLNAVLGFGELLEPLVSDNQGAAHYLEGIRTSGRALLDLINDILDLSKIEAGQLELRPVPSSTQEIADTLYLMFDSKAREKGIDLEIAVAEDLPETLVFDPQRVRQILINLVSNALKFTPEGSVTVRLESVPEESTTGDVVTLKAIVSDTGPGIEKDDIKKLFIPYSQTSVGANSEEDGTGLGLSISSKIAAAMGGSISAQSAPGAGATFILTIPNLAAAHADPNRSNEHLEPAPPLDELPAIRILAADDNAYNRTLLEGHFSGTRHTITIVKNGKEAVDAAHAAPPDLVLMDLRMPVMDGIEARLAIGQDPALHDVPVLAVTASSLIQDTAEIREKFDGYLRKPFTRSELYHAIAPHLQHRVTGDATAPKTAEKPVTAEHHDAVFPSPPKGHEVDWQNLSAAFAREAEITVPGLRASMAFGEISNLAEDLEAAAGEANCPPAAEFAATLKKNASTYQHAATKRQLESLAGFAEILAASSATTGKS